MSVGRSDRQRWEVEARALLLPPRISHPDFPPLFAALLPPCADVYLLVVMLEDLGEPSMRVLAYWALPGPLSGALSYLVLLLYSHSSHTGLFVRCSYLVLML